MLKIFYKICLIVVAFSKVAFSSPVSQNIRDFDFKAYFASIKPYESCLKHSDSAIDINKLDYFDFDGDGREEAILIASSCYTGTAGPDIHAVYKLDRTGKIRELVINDNKGMLKGKPIYNYLVGNRNYTLGHDKQFLTEEFHDNSGQEFPLTLFFKWSGSEFKLVDVIEGELYDTSFDCDKAKSDAEKTICLNQDIADSDLELAALYKHLMKSLAETQKKSLREEQLKWLIDRDKQCSYKWIDECLRKKYLERIEILKTRK